MEASMAPLKKHLTSISRKGGNNGITVHRGKGSTQERLPSASARDTLTNEDGGAPSMNQYAKATPSMEDTPPPATAPPSAMSSPGGEPDTDDLEA